MLKNFKGFVVIRGKIRRGKIGNKFLNILENGLLDKGFYLL